MQNNGKPNRTRLAPRLCAQGKVLDLLFGLLAVTLACGRTLPSPTHPATATVTSATAAPTSFTIALE
jgi:hypothetical protein